MKSKLGQLIETTLIVVYLLSCAVSSIYVVRSLMQTYLRAVVMLAID
jgi:hypothetical protein